MEVAVVPTDCDRRQSRAARDLLLQSFTQIKRTLISSALPRARLADLDETSSSVWEWIELIATTATATCPLLAHDILRQDEENTIVIPSMEMKMLPKTVLPILPRRLSPRKQHQMDNPPHYYKCAYCGKVFMTRYYIDQHMDRMHSYWNHTLSGTAQLPNTAATSMICPARDWCAFLSESHCRDHAVLLEPYYDRGSGGRGNDADMVARKVRKTTLQACTHQEMDGAQLACHEMIQSCFPNTPDSLESTLKEHLCGGLSCSDRLHKLVLQHTLGIKSWRALQNEWHDGDESTFLWLVGSSIVVVVSIFCYVQFLFGGAKTHSATSTTRLLRRAKPKHKVH